MFLIELWIGRTGSRQSESFSGVRGRTGTISGRLVVPGICPLGPGLPVAHRSRRRGQCMCRCSCRCPARILGAPPVEMPSPWIFGDNVEDDRGTSAYRSRPGDRGAARWSRRCSISTRRCPLSRQRGDCRGDGGIPSVVPRSRVAPSGRPSHWFMGRQRGSSWATSS